MSKVWSEGEIVLLEKMYGEGATDKSIADILGRTEYAVNQKRKKMGFTERQSNRMLDNAQMFELLSMRQCGLFGRICRKQIRNRREHRQDVRAPRKGYLSAQ